MAQKLTKSKICIANQEDDHNFSASDNSIIYNDDEPIIQSNTQSKDKELLIPIDTKEIRETSSKTDQISDATNSKAKMETLPIHEPKQLTKKESQVNEMLNYSLNSSTRAINKIPKGRYGYIEEYDLIKAEKMLSKRRTNVKYDQDIVYGKATQANANAGVSGAGMNGNKKRNDNPITYHNDIIVEKTESEEDNINDNSPNKDNQEDLIEEEPKLKVKAKSNIKPPLKREKKATALIEPQENNIKRANNLDNKQRSNTYSNSYNKNDHIDFNQEEDNTANHSINKASGSNKINPQNKNFNILFNDNTTIASIPNKLKDNSQQEEQNDIYSCYNCEPVYFLCIKNNEPLKVLKCLICNNLINKTSLEFYLKKYKDEIVLPQKKTKKDKGKQQAKKDLKPQQQQYQRGIQSKTESSDESGITEQWGMLIESNKARIKEQLIYDIVDGKTRLTKQQKELTLNKIKNTPLENIVKRKEGKDLHCNNVNK